MCNRRPYVLPSNKFIVIDLKLKHKGLLTHATENLDSGYEAIPN